MPLFWVVCSDEFVLQSPASLSSLSLTSSPSAMSLSGDSDDEKYKPSSTSSHPGLHSGSGAGHQFVTPVSKKRKNFTGKVCCALRALFKLMSLCRPRFQLLLALVKRINLV